MKEYIDDWNYDMTSTQETAWLSFTSHLKKKYSELRKIQNYTVTGDMGNTKM